MDRKDEAKTGRNEDVVNCLYRRPNAMCTLICFPWAGSGSIHFAKWGKDMQDSLEVHSIRLAGRERRLEEPFSTDICQIADEIVCALLPVLQDKPFAFFGHSLGSYIAFMTALHLKEKHKLEPMHLFVSSIVPPYSMARPYIPEENEVSEGRLSGILAFGDSSKTFINDKEFNQQYYPRLVADLHIIKNYTFKAPSEPVLSCDLTCFVGSEEILEDLEGWKVLTSGSFCMHVLPGNHFYLMEVANETFIKNYITKCLEIAILAGL